MRRNHSFDYRILLLCPALLLAPACGDDKQSSSSAEAGSSGDETTQPPSTTDTPDTDGPGTDAPTTDGPGTDGPTTDAPTTETPVDDTGSTGDPTDVPFCHYRCEVAEDCFIGGVDTQDVCDDGNCVPACEETPDCIAPSSGWTNMPCMATAECGGGVCVDYGTGTGCAFGPNEATTCADLDMDDVEIMDVDGNTVTVCGNTDSTCEAGLCERPISFDCNVDGCPDSLSCEADGSCRCGDDDACVDAGYGDACRSDGLCVFACDPEADVPCEGMAQYDGGAIVCE